MTWAVMPSWMVQRTFQVPDSLNVRVTVPDEIGPIFVTPVERGALNTISCGTPEPFVNDTTVPFGTVTCEGSKLAPCTHNVFAAQVASSSNSVFAEALK